MKIRNVMDGFLLQLRFPQNKLTPWLPTGFFLFTSCDSNEFSSEETNIDVTLEVEGKKLWPLEPFVLEEKMQNC